MNVSAMALPRYRVPSAKTIGISLLQAIGFAAMLYFAALICGGCQHRLWRTRLRPEHPGHHSLVMDPSCSLLCIGNRKQNRC